MWQLCVCHPIWTLGTEADFIKCFCFRTESIYEQKHLWTEALLYFLNVYDNPLWYEYYCPSFINKQTIRLCKVKSSKIQVKWTLCLFILRCLYQITVTLLTPRSVVSGVKTCKSSWRQSRSWGLRDEQENSLHIYVSCAVARERPEPREMGQLFLNHTLLSYPVHFSGHWLLCLK